MANEIDPATVQRCIEVLRGKGAYKFHGYGLLGGSAESWTYTTHPIDLLQALLPEPEKSEAEKLVDEFYETLLKGPVKFFDHTNQDDVEARELQLVQFVLDKVNAPNPAEVLRDIATDIAKEHGYTVDHQSFDAASEYCATTDSQPQYVFGPWIEWHGGECPVPDDWEVDYVFRSETIDDHRKVYKRAGSVWTSEWEHTGLAANNITHYRVRFEVGKWYSWAGGPCPVLPEQRVDVVCADGYKARDVARRFGKSDSHKYNWWTGECLKGGERNDQITSFRCVA